MRAIVYTAPLELEFKHVDPPQPAEDEAIVDVRAVGICGSELEGFASQSPFRVPPLIMGHEFAGVRVDTGERVVVNPVLSCLACDLCLQGRTNICRQRRIIGIQRDGGFAEQVAVPDRSLYVLPDDVPFTNAALVEPTANAVHAVRLLLEQDSIPQRVGVIGAGMLGFATALQCLRRGVPQVQLVDLSEERLETARVAGVADVATALEGEFDAVFDAVGSATTRQRAMEHVRPGGTCLWIGLHGPEAGFDGLDLIRSEKRVLGTFCYHDRDYRDAIGYVAGLSTDWVRMLPLEDGVDAFLGLLQHIPPEPKTLLIVGTGVA